MGVQVFSNYFSGLADVMQDLKETGFWPTTFVSEASPEIPLHWHDTDLHGYVLEGSTYVVDGESGKRLEISAGDKLVLPYGVVHAEGASNERVVYIVAMPEPRPFNEFLTLRSPDEKPLERP